MRVTLCAVVIITIVAVAFLLPLFFEVYREYAQIEDVEMKIKDLNESHVTLSFIVKCRSSGLNANIVANVYDRATNVLIDQKKVGLGESNIAVLNITFEKDKDYKVAFKIEKNGKVLDSRILSVVGLDTLIPKYKEVKMNIRDVDFQVLEVNGKVKLKARFYVESLENYSNITFHVKAIQYESNILADERWLHLNVKAGKTLLVECNFTVPKDYNYLVKLEVWRNGSMLRSWSAGVNLAPTKRIPQNVTEERVKFKVEEFAQNPPRFAPTPHTKAPGFEIVLGLIAMGGALVWRKVR